MDVREDIRKLQEHGVRGFTRFSIKAEDSEEVREVHEAFKHMAKVECGDDYTLALKVLMTYYDDRGAFEALWEKSKELEARIIELEQKAEQPKVEEVKNEAF
jgi:hypothetical protein